MMPALAGTRRMVVFGFPPLPGDALEWPVVLTGRSFVGPK